MGQLRKVPAMFNYGYIVRLPSGRLVPAGQSWRPSIDSLRPEDSLGIRNGKEGIVLSVVTGEDAKKNGYDVMIILEERAVKSQDPLRNIIQLSQELESPRLTSRPQIQADFQGKKMRAVGSTLHIRPAEETFHDFQINLLLWTLGKQWFDGEMAKPLEERHIILRWRDERNALLNANRKPGDDPKQPVRANPTGDVKALQVLADDIYQLEHALKTPRRIVERLRDPRQFQGARYEVAAASILARCGFAVNFIDESSKRNPEFIAEKSAERIAVEAKSRHREGVLHQRGDYDAEKNPAPAKIKDLYEQALGQDPGTVPFLVFVDVNLPLSPEVPPMEKSWVKEAKQAFDYRRQEGNSTDPDSGLVLTNFGWHYYRDRGSPTGEFVTVRPLHSERPVSAQTWNLLDRALSEYGLIVDEEEHEKAVRSRYPEFSS
jgi:hypothetical protein